MGWNVSGCTQLSQMGMWGILRAGGYLQLCHFHGAVPELFSFFQYGLIKVWVKKKGNSVYWPTPFQWMGFHFSGIFCRLLGIAVFTWWIQTRKRWNSIESIYWCCKYKLFELIPASSGTKMCHKQNQIQETMLSKDPVNSLIKQSG